MSSRWPSALYLVRHGQSAGNVARDAADAAGAERIELVGRDVDVPLSALGERQAVALGRWFAEGHEDGRPEILLSSPYVRAIQTAERFRAAGGCDADEPICIDERLREKEFGILDGLTVAGIKKLNPEQAHFREQLGKFYHRTPGGESWTDVILRLRSLLDTVSLHYAGRRVMIFGHQVVVLCMRYILENMDEAGILAVDKAADVANCSITEYRFDADMGRSGNMRLVRYNETAPVEAGGEPATAERDAIVAARGVTELDRDWLAAHPLPRLDATADKNRRGRVLLAGGAHFVPGALRLTGEAVLRAGAGKLQMATVKAAAFHLGMAVPEAAVIALPAAEDGEIDASAAPAILEAAAHADAFVLGPGMSGHPDALVAALVGQAREDLTLVLDAAAIGCCAALEGPLRQHAGRAILTPHHGEMAALTGWNVAEIAAEPERVAREAAAQFGAIVALKADCTVIATPDGEMLRFEGCCPGLATGGSGDVLAGIVGGLAARGAEPLTAIGWAVWAHGMAGRVLAERIGPTGFLARELLPEIPRLLA